MAESRELPAANCPTCGKPMRREMDRLRQPPMPKVFWFCINRECADGKENKIYYGG